MRETDNNESKMSREEWDAICEQCGRCCYEKLSYRGKILYTQTPCRHLDTETGLCTIYPERFKLHPECTQLTTELARAGVLPDDCPYVLMFARPGGKGSR